MFWSTLEEAILEAINDGMSKGEYSRDFLKTVIALLHKKGDPLYSRIREGISYHCDLKYWD
jgi:hypothetical protein